MNNELKRNEFGRVVLCGRKNGCCPEMERVDDSTVAIIDDDGNRIVIKKDQARLIGKGLDVLDENNEPKEQLLCD